MTEQAMFYSPQSLQTIDAIRGRLGRVLAQRALETARRNGRNLVTDGDVYEAVDTISLGDIVSDVHEGIDSIYMALIAVDPDDEP